MPFSARGYADHQGLGLRRGQQPRVTRFTAVHALFENAWDVEISSIRRLHDQRSRSRLALERLEVSDPMVEELGRNIERHIQAPAYVELERRL